METLTETELKRVWTTESWGSGGKFKLKIFMDIDRDFTDTDKSNIRKHAEKLEQAIRQESLRLDPKSKEQAREERAGILELFGGREILVEEIPNGYCSDWCCEHLPWFIVTTKVGRIKIGWRKRVLEIDWSDSAIKKTAKDLFAGEDVTKGDHDIHAWGYAKAKEYIDVLLSQ